MHRDDGTQDEGLFCVGSDFRADGHTAEGKPPQSLYNTQVKASPGRHTPQKPSEGRPN